jgi:hypothetical protein
VRHEDGYRLLAGNCKRICEAIASVDDEWTLVRGHYICPMWGERAHWWLKAKDGTIYDPTVFQFPTPRIGDYVEFDGTVTCSQCGKEMKEDEASFESNYAFCSGECHGRFVGVY